MKKIIAIALLLASGLVFAQSKTAQYYAEKAQILKQMTEGKFSELEATTEVEAAGRAYFPNDSMLHSFNGAMRGYAEQLNQKTISHERFMELVVQRQERWDAAISIRRQEEEAERQQQQRAASAANDQARTSNAVGVFLGSMANSLTRQYPRPITCASTAMPGVVTTNCQ